MTYSFFVNYIVNLIMIGSLGHSLGVLHLRGAAGHTYKPAVTVNAHGSPTYRYPSTQSAYPSFHDTRKRQSKISVQWRNMW